MARLTRDAMMQVNDQFRRFRYTASRVYDRKTNGQVCVNKCLDFVLSVIDEEDLADMDEVDAKTLADKTADACIRKCRKALEER
jgi:hypothetical protein